MWAPRTNTAAMVPASSNRRMRAWLPVWVHKSRVVCCKLRNGWEGKGESNLVFVHTGLPPSRLETWGSASSALQSPAPTGFRRSRLRIDQQGVVELLNGKLGFSQGNQQISEVGGSIERVGVEGNCPFMHRPRFGPSPECGKGCCQDERIRASSRGADSAALLKCSTASFRWPFFRAVSPKTNRSERVVRLNCKGMLDSCDRVAQLVVGEGVATAGNGEVGRPPPISGCGLSVDIQAVHVQDHSEGGDRPELFSLLELILAALRKKLDSFRWTGWWGRAIPLQQIRTTAESGGMKRARYRS